MSFLDSLKEIRGAVSLVPTVHRARNLMMEGSNEKALLLLGDVIGLRQEEYGSPERLRRRLLAWLRGQPNGVASFYCMALSSAFGGIRQMQQGLTVLETFLSIEAADYNDAAVLVEKLRLRLDELPLEMSFTIYSTLAAALSTLGRESEALALLVAYLGAVPTEPLETREQQERWQDTICRKATELMGGMMPDAIAMNGLTLIPLLDQMGVSGDRLVSLIETILGVEPDEFEGGGWRLHLKLRRWVEANTQEFNGQLSLQMMGSFLHQFGAPAKGLRVLEWCCGIEPSDYQDVETLGRRWDSYWSSLPGDVRATFFRTFVSVLREAGRDPRRDALAIIEADSGLRSGDYADPSRVARKLERRMLGLQIDTQSAYVVSLTDSLALLGYRDRANLVLDSYLRGYRSLWEVPPDGDIGIVHVVPLLTWWLEQHATRDRDFTFALCQQAVVYLRKGFGSRGVRLEDRRDFIRYVDDLRRAILEAGYVWTSEPEDDGGSLRLQVVLWDTELAQRTLLERFLLDPLLRVHPSGTPPATGLRLFRCRSDWVDLASQGRALATLSRIPAAADNGEAGLAARVEAGESLKVEHPQLYARLHAAIQRGVEESVLLEVLGECTVLLRVTFDAEARLIWTAVARDGARLAVVGTGRGQPDDLGFIRAATYRHDLRTTLAHLDPERPPHLFLASVERWIGFFERLRTMGSFDADEASTVWQETLLAYGEATDQDDEPVLAELELWERCLWWMWQPPAAPEGFLEIAKAASTHLQLLLDCFQTDYLDSGNGTAPAERVHMMTADLIEEVAVRWNLDRLADFLTLETHLILQVDDALHAFPVAHLPIAGKPLYSRVCSVRKSFTPMFQMLQQEMEGESGDSGDAGRMLVVSWFDSDDPTRASANDLLQGHFNLAREYALDFYSATEGPDGSAGSIRAGLDAYSSFDVLTVCGHGSLGDGGVKLLECDPWRGQGCDLSRVGLLLLVSCAIGRLNQERDLDVDGFCVHLAVHRAASVVACRWPVLARETCIFANEVVSQYLKLRSELAGPQEKQAGLRARALNAARRVFDREGEGCGPVSPVGVNTIAAFDLYGLG